MQTPGGGGIVNNVPHDFKQLGINGGRDHVIATDGELVRRLESQSDIAPAFEGVDHVSRPEPAQNQETTVGRNVRASINQDVPFDEDDLTELTYTYDRWTPRSDQSPLISSSSSTISVPALHVYHRRWYILFLYTMLAFMQGALGNVWVVIPRSAEALFGWNDSDISLMQTWLYVTYIVSVLPFAWLVDKKGLRLASILAMIFLVAGTALRCITTSPPYATRLAHAAHVLVGIAGPIAFTSGPMISARWFPPNQRSTATAVATIAGYAGGAGCFLFGPLIVEVPQLSPLIPPGTPSNFTNMAEIRQEILLCRYIECGICSLILILLLIYFPSFPPSAPSLTAAMDKIQFVNGMKQLFGRKNANFWLICIPFCTSVSVYGVWSGLFGVNLDDVVEESDIGWLGFSAVSAGCVAALVFGRISDLFLGHMKSILLVLNVGCILSTLWFILLSKEYIRFSKVELYAASILQGLTNNGAIPLYYELAIENTYPIEEVCVSTVMTLFYNFLPLVFLLIFLIPNIGKLWMDWCLYGALLVCFPILIAFKEEYKRLMVDRGEAPAPPVLQSNSQQHVTSNRSSSVSAVST